MKDREVKSPRRRPRRPAAALGITLGAALLPAICCGPAAAQPAEPARRGRDDKVLVVALTSPVGEDSARRLENEIRGRLQGEPSITTVILHFGASGGDEAACEAFALFLFREVNRRAVTVAWIPSFDAPMGEMVGPVIACREIILGPKARLSALPPDEPAGERGDELRVELRRQIEEHAKHYRRPTLLARALVDRDHGDILAVVYRKSSERPSLWEEGDNKIDFMTRKDFQQLDAQFRQFDRVDDELVCASGKALSMDAQQARKWKFSSQGPAAELGDVLLALDLDIAPSHVIDLERGPSHVSSETGQALVDFFNLPVVRAALILGGCLGMLLELKLLGTFIPGLAGLLCFVVLFVSSLYPVSGSSVPTATVFEIVLFLFGLGLVAIEFFFLPGVALFALAGGALCLVSLVLAMLPPQEADIIGQRTTLEDAVTIIVVGLGLASLGFAFLLRVLPKSNTLGGRGLVNQTMITGVPTADSLIASQLQSAAIIGKRGIADTPLRPAGRVILESGESIDVTADGDFIERGSRVVVIEARGQKITVTRDDDKRGET